MRINDILEILADFIIDYGEDNVSLIEGSAVLSFPQLEPMLKGYGSRYNYTAMPLIRVSFRIPAIADMSGSEYTGKIPAGIVAVEIDRVTIIRGDGSDDMITVNPATIHNLAFCPGGKEQKNMGAVRKLLDDLDETGL